MKTLLQDLRYGMRLLLKSPGFTVVAVVTLALGIGANSTIFSVMNATLMKGLTFAHPDRLVLVWKTFGPENLNIVSAPNLWDWQKQNHVFESMALFDSAGKGYNLSPSSAGQEAENVSGVRVTSDFFAVLGVKPMLGRGFLPGEDTRGNDQEVVLSYGLWKSHYAGDPALVGKPVRIDGANYTVVGVMPASFHFQFWSNERKLWVPAGFTEGDKQRGSNSFVAIARLKPGVSVSAAKAEMATIQTRLAGQYREDSNSSATVVSMASYGLEALQRALLALLAAVGFVLLIACVNVANLMLARGAARQKEFAIRRALGASGIRLARQLMAESVLFAAAGGIAGLLLARASLMVLSRALPDELSFLPFRPLAGITLDARVLIFTLLVSGLTSILFGVAPALNALRTGMNDPLKEGGRGSTQGGKSRLRHALVAAEVALALVILSGAGLMIESMWRLLKVSPGFNAKNVLVMGMAVPQKEIYYGPPDNPRFCDELQESVAAVPGIVSVGAVAHLPLQGNAGRGFQIAGRPIPSEKDTPGAAYTVACPNYFRTMGVPVLAGREFTAQDTESAPGVAVINEALARRYFPKQDPLGQRINLDSREAKQPWLTIVGVVANVHHWGLDNDMEPQFFRPYMQAAWPTMRIVARTTGAPMSFAAPIKKALASVEPERPVSDPASMEEIVYESLGSRRFPMLLLTLFAALALLLAAVGILGVVSYSVTQRTHEIGIRMALGARTAHVLRLVMGGGLVWVGAGLVAGIAGSLATTRLMQSMLYGVKPADPLALASVSLVLLLVALVAIYIPARRATRVDPLVALRYE